MRRYLLGRQYPFIDYSIGGNIDGTIKAAEANVAALTDKTIVIPGDGNPVSNKVELSAHRDMLVAIRDNIGKLKQQGRPLDETAAQSLDSGASCKYPSSELPRSSGLFFFHCDG